VIGDVARDSNVEPSDVGRSETQRNFPGHYGALSATRQFVAETLESWNLHHYLEDASIVVSELATNAVIHAHSDFTVSLSSNGGSLRVSVRDSSHVVPVLRSPLPTTVSGRGLVLVTAIATRWGTQLVDDGKLIWAEIGA
jgi:anti-sigma regulatory factor (Ser/Thr protein kinase)